MFLGVFVRVLGSDERACPRKYYFFLSPTPNLLVCFVDAYFLHSISCTLFMRQVWKPIEESEGSEELIHIDLIYDISNTTRPDVKDPDSNSSNSNAKSQTHETRVFSLIPSTQQP